MKLKIEKKEETEMCNFQIAKSEHKKLKVFLKKNKIKKCDFFRAAVQQLCK